MSVEDKKRQLRIIAGENLLVANYTDVLNKTLNVPPDVKDKFIKRDIVETMKLHIKDKVVLNKTPKSPDEVQVSASLYVFTEEELVQLLEERLGVRFPGGHY